MQSSIRRTTSTQPPTEHDTKILNHLNRIGASMGIIDEPDRIGLEIRSPNNAWAKVWSITQRTNGCAVNTYDNSYRGVHVRDLRIAEASE